MGALLATCSRVGYPPSFVCGRSSFPCFGFSIWMQFTTGCKMALSPCTYQILKRATVPAADLCTTAVSGM